MSFNKISSLFDTIEVNDGATGIAFGIAVCLLSVTELVIMPSISALAETNNRVEVMIAEDPACEVIEEIKDEIVPEIANSEQKSGGVAINPFLFRLVFLTALRPLSTSSSKVIELLDAQDTAVGVQLARDFLAPFKQKYCFLSQADLFTLAGIAVIKYMGGPPIAWRMGRKDNVTFDLHPHKPRDDHLSAMQYYMSTKIHRRLGYTDGEWMVLLGGGSFGKCYTKVGDSWITCWSSAREFISNKYFALLLLEKKKMDDIQGERPFTNLLQEVAFSHLDLTQDASLLENEEFKQIAERYVNDQNVFLHDYAAAFGKMLEMYLAVAEILENKV